MSQQDKVILSLVALVCIIAAVVIGGMALVSTCPLLLRVATIVTAGSLVTLSAFCLMDVGRSR